MEWLDFDPGSESDADKGNLSCFLVFTELAIIRWSRKRVLVHSRMLDSFFAETLYFCYFLALEMPVLPISYFSSAHRSQLLLACN